MRILGILMLIVFISIIIGLSVLAVHGNIIEVLKLWGFAIGITALCVGGVTLVVNNPKF